VERRSVLFKGKGGLGGFLQSPILGNYRVQNSSIEREERIRDFEQEN
jgi:hypothetical protein